MITSLKGFEETVSSGERDQCGRPDGSPGEGSLGPGQAAPRSGHHTLLSPPACLSNNRCAIYLLQTPCTV